MSSKKQTIVSTSIQNTWASNDLLFLGEWCKSFKKRNILKNISHQTLPYHWSSSEKLKKDHDYLSVTYESFLNDLAAYLNNFHEVNFSLQFWRILIGPWLLSFIATVWDRWEIIRTLGNNYDLNSLSYVKLRGNSSLPPRDYEDSIRQFGSDLWNEEIFSEIMSLHKIASKEVASDLVFSEGSRSLPTKTSIIKSFIRLATKPKKNLNLVIYQGYFPPIFLFLINILLKQKIRMDGYFDNPVTPIRFPPRQVNNFPALTEEYRDNFERFFQSKIIKYIPYAYLEGFQSLVSAAKSIPKASNILTANAHFGNELFKVWSGLNCEEGSNLIISSHGGAIYPKFSVFDHQEHIASKRIIWGKAWFANQITLPPNKLSYSSYRPNKVGVISIIDNDSLKYSYRCMSASQGPLVLKSFEMTKKLIEGLKDNLMQYKIKPKFSGDNETADRYLNFFGDVSIYPTDWSMKKVIKSSRLVICTYPQTAYAESIFSGVPTLLVYDSKIWQTQDIYKELLSSLRKNNMLFDDPEMAVKHIKSIYHDPFTWWDSPDVVNAKDEFMKMCISQRKNKLSTWIDFLRKQIKC